MHIFCARAVYKREKLGYFDHANDDNGEKRMSISITKLEQSVETLAAKLRKDGYDVIVDTFKSGHGGSGEWGTSYVEMEVSKEDEFYGGDVIWTNLKFNANGYGDMGKEEFGGWGVKWSEMKKAALAAIEAA